MYAIVVWRVVLQIRQSLSASFLHPTTHWRDVVAHLDSCFRSRIHLIYFSLDRASGTPEMSPGGFAKLLSRPNTLNRWELLLRDRRRK